MNEIFSSAISLHQMIDANRKSELIKSIPNLNAVHIRIDRNALLESLIVLDKYINQAVFQFQVRKLKIKPTEVEYFDKVEEALNSILKEIEVSKEFDRSRSEIRHFRTLRNQFAHYPHGMFALDAKGESFESFLKKIPGLNLGQSFWATDNKKAQFVIPYEIVNDGILKTYHKSSMVFLDLLLELFFPTKKTEKNN